MRAYVITVLVLCLNPISAIAGSPASEPSADSPSDPVDRWEFGYETSALLSFGGNSTHLDYTFLPQMLSLKGGSVFKAPWAGGDFVLRPRFSILAEPIIQGPESYFVGLGAGGSLEWWDASRTFSTYAGAGGGVGWLDAKGRQIPGGQGQDFNLHWYMHGGLRWRFAEQLSASLGVYFQHISNGGMNKINPGVDAIGPTLGLAWHF